MILDPLHQVVGHEEASVGCHVWVLWWAQHHMTELVTPLIFFPNGADVVQLYGSDVLSPALLGWVPLPPVLLYNLWVMALLGFGAEGVYRLCRAARATPAGAVVGATAFMTAPIFQHELLNGTSEMLGAGFLAWFALALHRLLGRPSLRLGLQVGLFAGLAVSCSAYNLFFLLVVGGSFVLHAIVTNLSPVLTPRVWRYLGAGVGVAALFGAPIAWLQARHGIGQTYAQREDFDPEAPPQPDSFVDLLDWIDPRAAEIPAWIAMPDGMDFAYWTTFSSYLGVVALILALAGILRKRALGPWGVMALVAGLIALGPYLRVGGCLSSSRVPRSPCPPWSWRRSSHPFASRPSTPIATQRWS